jgi:hypothetical protein
MRAVGMNQWVYFANPIDLSAASLPPGTTSPSELTASPFSVFTTTLVPRHP